MQLYDEKLMTGRGMGKYTYTKQARKEGEKYIMDLMKKYFPNNKIEYIV